MKFVWKNKNIIEKLKLKMQMVNNKNINKNRIKGRKMDGQRKRKLND